MIDERPASSRDTLPSWRMRRRSLGWSFNSFAFRSFKARLAKLRFPGLVCTRREDRDGLDMSAPQEQLVGALFAMCKAAGCEV